MADQNFDLLDFGPSSSEPEPTPEPEHTTETETGLAETSDPEAEPSDGDRETAILERLEEETGRRLQLDRDQPAAATEPEAPSVPNFMDGLDIDEVLSNSDNLNRLLQAVYNAGLGEAVRRASDNVLGSVNDLVSRYVREQLTMSEMVKEFYDTNPDLRPVRRTVAAIAREISAEDPELKPQDVFAKTAVKVREVLKLKPLPPKQSKNFAPQRGRKAIEPELVGIEKEIMELMEI